MHRMAQILDFLGKAVVARLFFCDVLLSMTMHTELQDVTEQQIVMRKEVEQLKKMDDGKLVRGASKKPTPAEEEATAKPAEPEATVQAV